jgi:hypothetical protein
METDNLRLKDAATARAYLRDLAEKIGDPQQMLNFLSACEISQAALVCWLHEEQHFDRIQLDQYKLGAPTDTRSKCEREAAWSAYQQASEEYRLSKQKLKELIRELH